MAGNITFGIITCSDTRSLDEDEAGLFLESAIKAAGWTCKQRVCVPDDRAKISAEIVRFADELSCDVIITCGGSGLSPRDVTPEATRDVCEREVLGIAEAMRAHSLAITPNAMLSRGVSMQRGQSLVINFPGSTKAARENWDAVYPALEHAVHMMAGEGHSGTQDVSK